MKVLNNKRDCTACRGCCVFDREALFFAPLVTPEERRAIEKHRALSRGRSRALFKAEKGIWQLRMAPWKKRHKCPFLDDATWLCGIYEVRPFDCRVYPYLPMWDGSGRTVTVAFHTGGCPVHENHPRSKAGAALRAFVRKMNSAPVRRLFTRHPGLVWKYDKDFTIVHRFRALTRELLERGRP